MKKLNEVIRNFDYTEKAVDLLHDNLVEMNSLPVVKYIIKEGRSIFRCRKHSKINDVYFFEKDISYRTDIKNIKKIGRCNGLYSSNFYGSLSSEEIKEGFTASVFETSSLLKNNEDGYEIFTIGQWIAKKDFEVFVIKPPKIVSDLNIEISNAYQDFINSYEFTDEQKEFHELLGTEFTKEVKDSENEKYAISAIIGENILNISDGIVFPATKADQKCFNIVMRPKNVEKLLELNSVIVGDLFKFKNIAFFRKVINATLSDSIPFKWKEVPENERISLNSIFDYFIKQGIDPQYIFIELLKQMQRDK